MRIGIQTWGSEGDIRPFVALGAGLRDAGHEVRLLVTNIENKDYTELSRTLGFDIVPVGMPMFADMAELERMGQSLIAIRNPLKQAAEIKRIAFDPAVPAMIEPARELCRWADATVGHFVHYPLTVMAEKAGVPHATVVLAHLMIPSRYTALPGLPSAGPWGNLFMGWVVRKFMNLGFLGEINRLRQQERLSAVRDVVRDVWIGRRLNLVAVSPEICQAQPDWGEQNAVCGFLSLPQKATPWEPTAELKTFLEAGQPPVYFTFGSLTPKQDPEMRELAAIFSEAAKLAGCRAIIQVAEAGAFRSGRSDDQVHYLTVAPHTRIFPRCLAVVHHGGAGTTQTALLSGVPAVPIPHINEQEFWGAELRRLGVSPGWVHRRRLTASRLAGLLRAVQEKAFGEHARRLGEKISKEDGVATAVKVIEEKLLGVK